MAFPDFDPARRKVLFFSRGRGRGHAIPDLEIVTALEAICPEAQVRLASYGTGARTLAGADRDVIDLGLPDRNPVNETIVLAGKLIGALHPDLVVTHEEFLVLPAARIFDCPVLVITDWFVDRGAYSTESLKLADEVVFIDQPGICREPECVKGKVHYTGPIVRDFSYRPADRERAREELGIGPQATVVLVLPGSWREREAPILDLVIEAFDLLEVSPKELLWVAGDDAELVRDRTAGRSNVRVIDYDPLIDRLMVASDVAITKGMRKTHCELDTLGVPALAISHGLNPIDDRRLAALGRAVLEPHEASACATRIKSLLAERREPNPAAAGGARRAAERIACWLRQ